MQTQDRGQSLKDFLSSVSDLSNKSEEQLLAVYFEAELYPQLRPALEQSREKIIITLKNKDAVGLAETLRQTFVGFETYVSSLPDQVASPIQTQTPEGVADKQALELRGTKTKQVLEEAPAIIETIKQQSKTTRRDYIEKLVHNYGKWVPQQPDGFFTDTTEKIISSAQSTTDASFEKIIDDAVPDSIPQREQLIDRLQEDRSIRKEIQTIQEETPQELPPSFIDATLSSPDPTFFKDALVQQITTTNKPLEETVAKATTLSTVSDFLQNPPAGTVDYSGFFTNISARQGTVIEKTLAPLADTIFSFFPKDVQETIVTRVLGASWNKEVSNNALLQRVLGPTLQSSPVQQAIQNGNALFASSGGGAVITKTQSFFVDVFVTVFHPNVSETYLQLAGLQKTQMAQSVGSYYLGLLAERGASYAAEKGLRTAGKAVAKKAAGTAVGKTVGTLLGTATGNPVVAIIGYLVGDILIDKIVGGLWRGAKKVFGFLTLDWLGKLVSGDYQSGPITKDPIFIVSAVLIGVVCLLFVIPLAPFSLGGSSVFQQTVQDNAFVQGVGGGDGGPLIDCIADPTNPICSMTACDPTTQDCRWPTWGYISQGPLTTCGGTHANSNAIDITGNDGADVYATIEGTVLDTFSGCGDNDGYLGNTCGEHYGNWVEIQGSTYRLKFGHLSRLSIAVHKGQRVSPTTVIGKVDHNGNSSGPHLHFGYYGPGGINSILPIAIPSCSNSTPGCPACPLIKVGGKP